MRQAKLPLKIGQFPIVENSTYTMDLPRQYDYNSLLINVAGTVNITTAFTAVRSEAPAQIIKRLDLIADGTIIVQSWSGPQLLWGNFDRLASMPAATKAQIGTPPADAATGGDSFSFAAYVDFDTVRGIRPKDTSFRTNALTQWQLRVTFGTVADMYTGAGAGVITAGTVTVGSVQTVEYPDASGKTSNPPFVKRVSLQSYTIPSSNSALEFRLNTGNLIKAISIRTSINGEASNGIINSIQLAAAQDVRANLSGQQLQSQHLYNFGPPLVAGYYLLDFTENGGSPSRLADSWDVSSRLIEPKLILDVTGGAGYQIDVATIEIQPVVYK